jgi:OmpA-OmpF porin, OOP family
MKKGTVSSVCLAVLAAICFIPAVAGSFELITKTETVTFDELKIEIKKTAENFIILYDTSSSMGEIYKDTGKKKIELEKDILKTRNEALPELSFNGGLYTFTPKAFALYFKALKPFYEVKPYNKAEFAKAIDQLPLEASGTTPLQLCLYELEDIVAKLKGHTVVFLVTDAEYTRVGNLDKPIDIARELARKYDVSFFVIDSSGKKSNPQLQYAVGTINARSRAISYDQFLENPLFLSGALFVLDKRIVKKSIDIEKIIGARLSDALFEFDSAQINPKYTGELNKLGEFMQKNPKAIVALSGFTDNKGSTAYNLDLSRRRVESVAAYLDKNFKITPERMVLNYYGEANPVASNDTAEGRSLNRRIEGFIFGME